MSLAPPFGYVGKCELNSRNKHPSVCALTESVPAQPCDFRMVNFISYIFADQCVMSDRTLVPKNLTGVIQSFGEFSKVSFSLVSSSFFFFKFIFS